MVWACRWRPAVEDAYAPSVWPHRRPWGENGHSRARRESPIDKALTPRRPAGRSAGGGLRWASARAGKLFRTALAGRLSPFTVLHLHGPGGVGKTTLLHEFALDIARESDRPVIAMDGRDVPAIAPLVLRGSARGRRRGHCGRSGADATGQGRRPDRHLRVPGGPGSLAARHAVADMAAPRRRGAPRMGGAGASRPRHVADPGGGGAFLDWASLAATR